jgi:hypothetical protein
MSRADFHCHSTSSDGRLTPTQLVDLAAERGVTLLALTDHDSVEGVEEALRAAERHPEFSLIPGVEMSTDIPGAEVHVLGYFLSPEDRELQEILARLRHSRLGRARRMVDKLRAMDVEIEWERVRAIAGDAAVGRPHVAQALLEKGHISSIAEAFDRFIGRNGPAYAEREKMTPVEVVAFLAKKNGMPILAHPADLDNLDEMLHELKAAGLVGMEAYYQHYDEGTIDRLLATARQHDLLATGGSDFHGFGDERERLLGDIPLPDEAIDAFLARAPKAFHATETR